MKLLLYAENRDEKVVGFEKQILSRLPEVWLKTTESAEDLVRELSLPLNAISVILLVISSQKIFNNLLGLTPLFENKKLILVLSGDMDDELSVLCHQLTPSFITYLDADMGDALQVLGQIQQKHTHFNYRTFKTIQ